ncbi:ferredoxin [Streptomyces brasiliensis]|uniref:Ferredoxin n=1 Tax=Streptomyces brasiliensis TaxID=1954 RepID=A0A917L221_9ACTN|nr:ferredoxin [Streptomyces brasiliensis]GGJ41052.1 ferredoxin [Streptomyces brasiliensis]
MTKAVIDTDKCVGHGQCAMMAPDVFDLDADGYARVIAADITGDLRRDTETAAMACPEQAIGIED